MIRESQRGTNLLIESAALMNPALCSVINKGLILLTR